MGKHIPREECCEAAVFRDYDHSRCQKQATNQIVVFPTKDPDTGLPSGEPRMFRCCGIHKRHADQGREIKIIEGSNGFRSKVSRWYAQQTEVERIKLELGTAKWDEATLRERERDAKIKAGDRILKHAPNILELLYMVAERGDERAFDAIRALEEELGAIDKTVQATEEQNAKIADLKAQLAKLKRGSEE